MCLQTRLQEPVENISTPLFTNRKLTHIQSIQSIPRRRPKAKFFVGKGNGTMENGLRRLDCLIKLKRDQTQDISQ